MPRLFSRMAAPHTTTWSTNLHQSKKEYSMGNKSQSLQPMVLGKLDSSMQNIETVPLSYTMHKNEFKMDERCKCETGNHQNLKENTGRSLFDLSHRNLLEMAWKARETKAKINYWT